MKELFERYIKYLEKKRKYKSLERLRQEYLEKVDKCDKYINTIFLMNNWSEDEKRSTFKNFNIERAGYKEKASELENQIKEL